MKFLSILLALLLTTLVKGFVPSSSSARQGSLLYSTAEEVSIEPKDVVKLFGRLAEKYIMLDESGGMCCYSACKDCEYRLPGGGYKMADQSAARPKWIPVYEERNFAGQNKEHKTKWSTEIFSEGPSVTKEEFVQALTELQYAPPLGGPFVGATAAQIEDTAAAEKLFDILAGEKEKLARFKMSLQLKELAGGEQGLTWKDFAAAMGV
ncbi:MAG: hypothetical protein SGBAC_006439 [Bacillariaceae sp.]